MSTDVFAEAPSPGENTVPSRLRAVLLTAAAAVGAGAAVALVFLVRAGSAGAANWPVEWEFGRSDNSVLFQLLQDVAAGRTLDWSFSPQVYIFPELPVSAVSYVLAGGDIYWYYLAVAVINGMLLFLGLVLLVTVLFRSAGTGTRLVRAATAFAPLVILPLVGGAWLPAFHLAPTYYFGMYLMLFTAPAFFFVRGRVARVVLGAALALTAASNPLVLVFCGLPFTIALAVLASRRGIRAAVKPALAAAAVLVAAAVVRLVVFSPLQGVSPLAYVDSGIFATRMASLGSYLSRQLADPATCVVFVAGAVLALLSLVAAIALVVRVEKRRIEPDRRVLSAIYLGFVPVLGLACTLVLTITNYLYLWPVLIAPFMLAVLALPVRWNGRSLAALAAAFIAVLLATGGVSTLANASTYFGYRGAEARCLDENLPRGSVGYATYFDARRLTVQSATGIRLVPLSSDLSFRTWLTNLDYRREFAGSFFYLNSANDEPELSREGITGEFGSPDEKLRCDDHHEIWLYTDQQDVERIAKHYRSDAGLVSAG